VSGRDNVLAFLGLGIGLLLGMIGHEYAHARFADAFGDKTARLYGRLTINPAAHVDPLGTLILPGIFLLSVLVGSPIGFVFGWAKPVPISPHRMRSPRTNAMLVALAGPAYNFAIAALAGAGYRAASSLDLKQLLLWIVIANVWLGIINALPIPPLDGSKVLARFLSPQAAFKMEELGQYGLLFLLLIFFVFRNVVDAMADGIIRPLIGA
jgi:Zn-dependent protease